MDGVFHGWVGLWMDGWVYGWMGGLWLIDECLRIDDGVKVLGSGDRVVSKGA
jgi:hypothetical protein